MAAIEPESQSIAWKKSLSLKPQAMESLSGMLNSDCAQGTIALGVAPDGEVVGVDPGNLDKAQRSLLQFIQDNCSRQSNARWKYAKMARSEFLRYRQNAIEASLITNFVEGLSFAKARRRDNLASLKNSRLNASGIAICIDRCGSYIGILSQIVRTNKGIRKTYTCKCGGEFWPAS
jgi:Putative DNA-binding domain